RVSPNASPGGDASGGGVGEVRAFGGTDSGRMDCHRRLEVPGSEQCEQRAGAGRRGTLSGKPGNRGPRGRTHGGKQRGGGGSGETARSCGAGSRLYENAARPASRLQRADGGGRR